MMELANKTASYNFFVLGEVDSFIRDIAKCPLEIVTESDLSLKAASYFSKYETTAGNHSTDNLADSSLLGW